MSEKVVAIIGSSSDLDTMHPYIQRFKSFGVSIEVRIISVRRTPAAAERLASQARENGFGAITTAAGRAAHLVGVLAAYTVLSATGVPIKTSMMDGLDTFLSMVQISKRAPVAYVAVDDADSAAILSAQILALPDEVLSDRLVQFEASMAAGVETKDYKI